MPGSVERPTEKERGGRFCWEKTYLTIADINAFTYASTAYWAKVDTSGLDELNSWIKMLMERGSFQKGLEIPFARRGFFGPPFATQEEIDAEIQRNAGQFTVTGGSAAADGEKK